MLKMLAIPFVIAAVAMASEPAAATVTVIVSQVGANVVASLSGTLDTAGLLPDEENFSNLTPGTQPRAAFVAFGTGGNEIVGFDGAEGPTSFGPRVTNLYTPATTSSGDTFGINGGSFGQQEGTSFGPKAVVFLSPGYVSGNALSATETFDNQTLASLGFSIGQRLYVLPHDYILVDIGVKGGLPSSVPEISTWLMIISGIGATGCSMRRRMRTTPPAVSLA